jgi:hypothetical protein
VSDQIDRLTASQETELADKLAQIVQGAIDRFDSAVVSAILGHADEDGVSDHERDQLATVLGEDTELDVLATAFAGSAIATGLGSFFAALAALAVGAVGHVLNANSTDASTARDTAVRSFRSTFLTESSIAVRETAARMLSAIGNVDTRAAQIRRVIGLSSAQARSLDAIRQALHTYLAAPQRNADVDTLLAFARGHLSAAQRQMLAKALRSGIDLTHAEALLDRHAEALRIVRIKALAGHTAHQFAETAKVTGWQIAQRFGALPADQRRYWQTAGDERVRQSHSQVPTMNRAGVPLNQPFATPLGPCFIPPLEYGCRCKATLGAPRG